MPFHPQPLFFLVFGLVLGTLAPLYEVSSPLIIALGLAALLSMAAITQPSRIPLTALIVAAGAAGAGLGAGARLRYAQQSLPETIYGVLGAVIIEGIVATDPRILDDEIRFEIDALRVTAEGVGHDYRGRIQVFLSSTVNGTPFSGRVEKGDEISAWVSLRRPEPTRTPGGFDQAEWARRAGLHAFATCKSEQLVKVTRKRSTARTPIDRARNRLKSSWRHVQDPSNRAVTASMVLGDEGALGPDTKAEFRSAGLLHLLVVSGSQVAALIFGLRRVMPLPLRIAWSGCFLEWGVLVFYCLLTGAEDSIVRATLMAMAFAVAVRLDLKRSGANFLAGAALMLLGLRPLDALDPGAQMSFAAALGLVTFAAPAGRRIEAMGAPGFLADVIAATFVASITVAPLTLIHFHRLSLISLPANLLAAPLAVLLLYGSLATALLDTLMASAAPLLGAVCELIATALRGVAHHAAALDPDWRAPSPPWVLVAGLIGLVTGAGWRRKVLPIASVLAGLTMSSMPRGDGRVHFWFLDVGQGDALLVETPRGRVVVIDGGPAFQTFDAGERVVAEALWELGHRRVDFMLVTHRHADHEGGAPFLARHFSPQHIYVTGESARLTGLRTTTVRRGDSWAVDGLIFSVLGPDPAWPLPGRDENARSLVVEIHHGESSALLLGDASVLAESFLDLPHPKYDLVKVGHHGAATSSSDRLVQQTRPRIAVISVGSRNRFSHPSPQVVNRWQQVGALVWRTDTFRTLHLASDGTGFAKF